MAWYEKWGVVLFHKNYRLTTWVMCFTSFVLNFLFYGGLYAFLQILPDNSQLFKSNSAYMTAETNIVLGVLGRFPGYFIGLHLGRVIGRKQGMQFYLLGVTLG